MLLYCFLMYCFVPQVLTRDDASIWPGMSAPAKAAVKGEMLACIREEQQRGVTKKVGGSCLVGGWLGAVCSDWRLSAGPSPPRWAAPNCRCCRCHYCPCCRAGVRLRV